MWNPYNFVKKVLEKQANTLTGIHSTTTNVHQGPDLSNFEELCLTRTKTYWYFMTNIFFWEVVVIVEIAWIGYIEAVVIGIADVDIVCLIFCSRST